MENKYPPPNRKAIIYFDKEAYSLFESSTLKPDLEITEHKNNADFRIEKSENNLILADKNIKIFYLPFNKLNLLYALKVIRSKVRLQSKNLSLDRYKKILATTQRKIFSKIHLSESRENGIWEDFVRLIAPISLQSHSLFTLIEKLFQIPMLKNFSSIFFFIQLKGQSKTNIYGVQWKSEIYSKQLNTKDFNYLFQHVKKAKFKTFSTEFLNSDLLPFYGNFLAQDISHQKFNLIVTASRNDFLPCEQDEIDIFKLCIHLLQPHIVDLVEKEFLDNQISELKNCILHFPTPIKLEDLNSISSFGNELFNSALSDRDIFLTETKPKYFNIHFYDSPILQNYAFDIFHFQRVSLLGELLNTLRHELSNPLFGLKLSMELLIENSNNYFDQNLCIELQKNIQRCHSIIENFSSLYRNDFKDNESRLDKIIAESITISKSEIKDIKVIIEYENISSDSLINQPFLFILQILFNLIINASHSIKKSNRKGIIKILLRGNNSFVHFIVMDNGCGIAEDQISNLFKPFFTTKKNGNGLGLILSRNLAIQMNGDLECSEKLNEMKGASFTLKIPINEKNSYN